MNPNLIRVESIQQLMEALSVRKQVFVEEQGIDLKKDIDGNDHAAKHILIYDEQTPIATGRLLIHDVEGHISRIAVLKPFRNQGLGKQIVAALEEIAGDQKVEFLYLNAHDNLRGYYKKMGYAVNTDAVFHVGRHKLIKMTKSLPLA